MPWKSDAQRRWGHSPAGIKALGKKGVKEWDRASKSEDVPEKVTPLRDADAKARLKKGQ